MNQARFLIAVLMMLGSLGGCGTVERESPSTFKTEFSLGAIVEANKEYLIAGPRLSSGTEVGPQEPFAQKHEELIVQVDPAQSSAFMEGIRSGVEAALVSSKAEILGRSGGAFQEQGSEADGPMHFSLSYDGEARYGVIQVWGIQGKETDFTLIALVTESRGQ